MSSVAAASATQGKCWIQSALNAKIKFKLDDNIYMVLNLSEVRRQIAALHAAFPPTALHAFACKANPLLPMLQLINQHGMGCEVASIGEYTQARRAFPGNRIVFDSPCKTLEELKLALYNDGGFVNLDNFQELDRVVALDKERPVTANVGMRVNTQIGQGTISALDTCTAFSKFGVALNECREQLKSAYKQHRFLNMIHIHSGSQGLNFEQMTTGIRTVVDFVTQEIEGGAEKVPNIDIGGGLSVNFSSDEVMPTFGAYAAALKERVPELFPGATTKADGDDTAAAETSTAAHQQQQQPSKFRIITEMGRSIVMKAGVYLSRVEYTKVTGGRHIVLQHVGADLLLRTAWAPESFPLRVEIFNADGTKKPAAPDQLVRTDVAGPCCFAGDLACKDRALPKASPGDFVAIKDVGGYYYVSYNYYNVRQAPAVAFFEEETEQIRLVRRADTVQDTIGFFDKPPLAEGK